MINKIIVLDINKIDKERKKYNYFIYIYSRSMNHLI
jgi:hypothetical protein